MIYISLALSITKHYSDEFIGLAINYIQLLGI